MKNSNFLKEMSWTTFDKRRKETNLVIITSGAFEVYGPHLPLGSDTLVGVKIAELVSERINSIIGPTLEVGDSAVLDEFPGTITIKPESFKSYLFDCVKSMERWGFKDFLFINPHLGNVPLIEQISYEMQRNEISDARPLTTGDLSKTMIKESWRRAIWLIRMRAKPERRL